MPTGKIKFFDPDRGFGFITGPEGSRVYLHASLLPDDVPNPKPGLRVEYGVADGRRGPQAISLKFLDDPAAARAARRKPQDMVVVVEDVIKVLDSTSDSLRRGRYPGNSRQVAKVLRAIADDFDA